MVTFQEVREAVESRSIKSSNIASPKSGSPDLTKKNGTNSRKFID